MICLYEPNKFVEAELIKERGRMMYSYNPYYESYLAHHGIKGQKWGIRRYQNTDGSLTDKGKKHYNKQKSIADADVNSVLENFDKYSTNELREVKARGLLKKDLQDISNSKKSNNYTKETAKIIKSSNKAINDLSGSVMGAINLASLVYGIKKYGLKGTIVSKAKKL